MFKVDYSKTTEFEGIKAGEYEVIIHSVEQKKSSTGKEMVVVDYEIRDDVDQPSKGMKVRFDNFVVDPNNEWRFQSLSKAVGIPEETEFNSYKDWGDYILNQPILLNVGIRKHNGNDYAQAKGFKPSAVAPPEPVNISDEDTPF
ncbi:DUF669 domain-containing protein [Shouchella lehensis]|uniref:DUF669 domain-containing protein n=1 Tax=Shouchella lehensis G1 TaxID=1246626 RepID=A0A060M4D5_9BACI|nr:DUF669 domain-containing protein [Shouchella lehensis]AIC95408.1 hypothetical protein BleG1_2844 [Shouchella lehensis G1]